MQQEELARLFSQNLTLSNHALETPSIVEQPQAPQQQQQQHQEQYQQRQQQQQQQNPPNPQPVVYSSTHYTHSAHLAPKPAPPQPTPFTSTELSEILTSHSIDPTTLFPSQLDLFQQSPHDAQLRLLELWRLSPPDYSNRALALELGNWPRTSLEQEEEMARLRFERRARHSAYQGAITDGMMEQDATPLPPLSVSSISPPPDEMKTAAAEPYMLSGYEALVRRDYDEQAKGSEEARYTRASDPVYKSAAGWEQQGLREMENQYGAFAQTREYDTPQFVGVHGINEDMMMM